MTRSRPKLVINKRDRKTDHILANADHVFLLIEQAVAQTHRQAPRHSHDRLFAISAARADAFIFGSQMRIVADHRPGAFDQHPSELGVAVTGDMSQPDVFAGRIL